MDGKKNPPTPNIVDLLLDAVVMVDVRGCIVFISAACEHIFGYTPDEMIGRTMIDLVVPEDRAKTWEEAMQVMAGKPRIGFENRYVHKDGYLVHVMWSARWSEQDQLRIGVARDITDRKRAEEMQAATYAISEAAHGATDLVRLFREIHQIIARLVSVAGCAFAIRDAAKGTLVFPYQIDLLGNAPAMQDGFARKICAEVMQTGLPILVNGEHGSSLPPNAAMHEASDSWLVVPMISQSETLGAVILRSYPGTAYRQKDKELMQFVATQLAAALDRRRLNAELLRAARHDELTGLPNRRLFYDRLASALARTRRHHSRAAVLYIDVDDFKTVNDTYGHTAGDRLLQEIAKRILQCVREEDTVARLGGDEFAVLLEEVREPDAVASVVEKIRSAVALPISLEGQEQRTRLSIGIALYPDHGTTIHQLLEHADRLMYQSKKEGRHSRQ
ncbi:GGDEF domain-containing protein [Noviherbaspirillum agri]